MITGQEKPDTGTFRVGETVEIGYVDQNRDALDPNKTVFEEISDGLDNLEMVGARSTRGHMSHGSISKAPINRRKSGC